MTFWGYLSSLGLITVILASLYLTKLAINQQEEEKSKKLRVRNIRSELIDIDEIVHTLLIYDRNMELIELFIRYMTDQIQKGLKMLPDSEELQQELRDVDQLNEKTQALLKEPKEPETPSSDRQIFIIKNHFVRTIKLIKQLQGEGYFDEITASDHRSRLVKNSLMIEVKAYEQQGDGAQHSRELGTAANFYKHAKELLTNTDLRFPEKTELIKGLSKKLSGLYVSLPKDDTNQGERDEPSPPS